jgi:hypothetical protein
VKAGAAGLGGLAALALLLPMEAGVPIPLPADLVMFTVGERVAAGMFPPSWKCCDDHTDRSNASTE